MKNIRYIPGTTTLQLDTDRCVGCGACVTVCPHRVMALADGKAVIQDRDACMECGACAVNCPTDAVHVVPGVGCAPYILKKWLTGKGSCGPDCC